MKVYAYNAVSCGTSSIRYKKEGWYLCSREPTIAENYCYDGSNIIGFLAIDDPDICAFLDSLIGDIPNTEYREIEL